MSGMSWGKREEGEASVVFACQLGMAGTGSASDQRRRGTVHIASPEFLVCPGVLSSVGALSIQSPAAGLQRVWGAL